MGNLALEADPRIPQNQTKVAPTGEPQATGPRGKGITSVTRRFDSEIPRIFPKIQDFVLLLKRLRDSCGIRSKIVLGKKGKKGQFLSKNNFLSKKLT